MFRITADITIGALKPIKPNAVSWKRSIDTFSDTALVKLPAVAMLKKEGTQYESVATATQLKRGDAITILAGYDGNNTVHFKGFVARINFTTPLEVECEGYSWLLRKVSFTKSYQRTTLRTLLQELTAGTAIKLHSDIPDVPLTDLWFKEANGIEVLDYLKKKCLLTIYFVFDELYAGLRQLPPSSNVNLRLGFNTVKDDQLKFKQVGEDTEVTIRLPRSNGTKATVKKGKPNASNVKQYKVQHLEAESNLSELATYKQERLSYEGYEGSITCFLVPYVAPGYTATISDGKYVERAGKYYVDAVEGSVSSSGGRQVVTLGGRVL